ncbi:hypothetical protein D9M70_527220 [compost metagenome]
MDGPSGVVNEDIHAFGTSAGNVRNEIGRGPVIDTCSVSQLLAPRQLLIGTGDSYGVKPFDPRDLARDLPHRPGGGRDQHCFTWFRMTRFQ